jgi:hypothetical protein
MMDDAACARHSALAESSTWSSKVVDHLHIDIDLDDRRLVTSAYVSPQSHRNIAQQWQKKFLQNLHHPTLLLQVARQRPPLLKASQLVQARGLVFLKVVRSQMHRGGLWKMKGVNCRRAG